MALGISPIKEKDLLIIKFISPIFYILKNILRFILQMLKSPFVKTHSQVAK